jgi:hypothetical protein
VALEHVLADARGRVLVHEIDRDRARVRWGERGGQRVQPLLASSD